MSRIVALSDQHGFFPDVPECDLLIVAGDQCPDSFGGLSARAYPTKQWAWFRREWFAWLSRQPVKECVLTWGNHDYLGLDAENKVLGEAGTCTVTAVCDNTYLTMGGLNIYLTPWSNQFRDWAFMKQPEVLERYYKHIPEGLDILVSHQPPMGFGGRIYDWKSQSYEELGSYELLNVIKAKRPKAVICGHIHGAYGQYVLECKNADSSQTDIPIYNVSVVNEAYELVHPPTIIELPEGVTV